MAMTRRELLHRAGFAAALWPLTNATGGCVKVAGPPGAPAPSTGHEFHNWSHTISFNPSRYFEPTTEEQVIAIVRDCLAAGTHVRTQGAGHSFSQLLATPDTLLSLDRLDRPLSVDGHRVTVPAGIRLKNLIPALREKGLALRNLGSITEQSIAGAFSTGTHGSGLRLGAISTQVIGARLVDGNGAVRTIKEEDAADLAALRINLGALGILTEVTLDCVPDYQLEYSAYVAPFDEVIEKFDALNRENDRVVMWWLVLPGRIARDSVILITKNPVPPGRPRAAAAERELPSQAARARLPKATKDLQPIAAERPTTGFKRIRHFIDDYDKALTIPLLPVFHRECEYAIPVERTAEALKEFRRVIEETDVTLELPLEVRFVAKDDILLSPANGRDVSYIGASTLFNSTEVFERFEPIMKALGGRSHWGKNFTLTRAEVAAMWPGTYETFAAVANRYDPQRVFRNSLLSELFP
jgi:FAD/FMN-containing dehydrogenase